MTTTGKAARSSGSPAGSTRRASRPSSSISSISIGTYSSGTSSHTSHVIISWRSSGEHGLGLGAAPVAVVADDLEGEGPGLGLVLLGHVALDLVEEQAGRPEPAPDDRRVAGHVDEGEQERRDRSRRGAPRRSPRPACRTARRRGGCACRDLSCAPDPADGGTPPAADRCATVLNDPVRPTGAGPGGTVRHVMIEGPGGSVVAEAPDPMPSRARTAPWCRWTPPPSAGPTCTSTTGTSTSARPSPSATSSSARSLEVGPEVRRFRPGDRVLTASVAGCGACDGCATGDPVRCVEGPQVFGSGMLPGRPGHRGGRAGGRLPDAARSPRGWTTRRPCC